MIKPIKVTLENMKEILNSLVEKFGEIDYTLSYGFLTASAKSVYGLNYESDEFEISRKSRFDIIDDAIFLYGRIDPKLWKVNAQLDLIHIGDLVDIHDGYIDIISYDYMGELTKKKKAIIAWKLEKREDGIDG